MPDIIELISKWWKQMLAIVLLSLLTVGVITFLKPRLYLSVATAVPASSFGGDRAKIFNENIQELYSALGTADDLDMIIGTAQLDTVYLAVTDTFNLFDHYKISEKADAARTKAASELRSRTKVMKSEYGELKVKVWDTDKELAPQLSNAIMEQLAAIHQDLQASGNKATLQALRKAREKMESGTDSLLNGAGQNEQFRNRLLQYEKLIGEYQLMVDTKPPSLLIIESARPSVKPDKPRSVQIMIATGILSLLFALFAALVIERQKKPVN